MERQNNLPALLHSNSDMGSNFLWSYTLWLLEDGCVPDFQQTICHNAMIFQYVYLIALHPFSFFLLNKLVLFDFLISLMRMIIEKWERKEKTNHWIVQFISVIQIAPIHHTILDHLWFIIWYEPLAYWLVSHHAFLVINHKILITIYIDCRIGQFINSTRHASI